jgi:murein DD-endopeptidase MepM/ murein hydrolase activator NlpD
MTNSTSTKPKIHAFWHIARWIFLALGVLVVLFIANAAYPISYILPHQKPSLILPFEAQYDPFVSLMPMGEKIYHPDAPDGHPGIDFGADTLTEHLPYIAAMDGKVTKVHIYASPEKASSDPSQQTASFVDVVITNGSYQTVYSEMDAASLPAAIKLGAMVKQGDLIGYGNYQPSDSTPGAFKQMIHWEFGSTSPIIDRFCPLAYFTADSASRIEAIWAHTDTPRMKAAYPMICNGGYQGKAEK